MLDHNAGQWYYFSASAPYLGNKIAAYNGRLTFDLWHNRNPQSDTITDIALISGPTTLAYNFTPPPANTWTAFNIPLAEGPWRVTNLSGAVATASQVQAVLSNLTAIHIRGEFTSQVDTSRLDNVRLHAGVEVPISGTVTLLDWIPDEAGYPLTAQILVNGSVVESHPITLGAGGSYSFTCNTQGQIQVRIRGGHFLAKTGTLTTAVTGQSITYVATLRNGDADQSGEVDAADIDLVIAGFGGTPGSPGYNPNTDLDGSQEVDAADIDIAIAYFGSVDE